MPVDSQAFMSEWRGKELDGIVEQVKDGSTMRVRLLLPEGDHQVVNLALAGVRASRASGKPGETSEPFGEEGKFFTETRLLQRGVKVTLRSLPGSTAASPFQSSGTDTPTSTASIFIGTGMPRSFLTLTWGLIMHFSDSPCGQCRRVPRCQWSRSCSRLARRHAFCDSRRDGAASCRRKAGEGETPRTLRHSWFFRRQVQRCCNAQWPNRIADI
jgi:hypothetical protein